MVNNLFLLTFNLLFLTDFAHSQLKNCQRVTILSKDLYHSTNSLQHNRGLYCCHVYACMYVLPNVLDQVQTAISMNINERMTFVIWLN